MSKGSLWLAKYEYILTYTNILRGTNTAVVKLRIAPSIRITSGAGRKVCSICSTPRRPIKSPAYSMSSGQDLGWYLRLVHTGWGHDTTGNLPVGPKNCLGSFKHASEAQGAASTSCWFFDPDGPCPHAADAEWHLANDSRRSATVPNLL